jgi:hypothetical protein
VPNRRLLEPFETEEQHAERFDCAPRTIRRWRSLPDGLPYTKAGRVVLLHPEWTAEWLTRRRRQHDEVQGRATKRSPATNPTRGDG